MQPAFLILDIGTGNTRAGLFSLEGAEIDTRTIDTQYVTHPQNSHICHFEPEGLWQDILKLCRLLTDAHPDREIVAMTATSQREGIVLIGEDGSSLIGMPNIDYRGAGREKYIENPDLVYRRTGRNPAPLFPAMKLMAMRAGEPELYGAIKTFTSLSDWIGYMFTGRVVYESSQASESMLMDVESGTWDPWLCESFQVALGMLPEIGICGELLGTVQQEAAKEAGLSLNRPLPFVIGAADTQMAVVGAAPEDDDIVIVSGTTTPMVQLTERFVFDEQKRCWINRHAIPGRFVVETNVGTSGLNYQRLRPVFFPNETYQQAEEKMEAYQGLRCLSAVCNMLFEQNQSLNLGGFRIPVPVPADLSGVDFAKALLFDIASSVRRNFITLNEIVPNHKPYVIGCGGGFRGSVFPQMVADLLGRSVVIRDGFSQSSIRGCVTMLRKYFNMPEAPAKTIRVFEPDPDSLYPQYYEPCEKLRVTLNT